MAVKQGLVQKTSRAVEKVAKKLFLKISFFRYNYILPLIIKETDARSSYLSA